MCMYVCICARAKLTPYQRRWMQLRKQKRKRASSKPNMVNLFVFLLAKTFLVGFGEPSHLGPEPPPPPPPPLPVPPSPPSRRSEYSRARFDANFRTARPSSRTKRKRDESPPARRIVLQWTSSEPENSPEKLSIPPKRRSGDFNMLLGEFEIEDEFGKWTFEEYSSNRTGGATFVVSLNGSPLIGDFGKFDKASFSHNLVRCKNQTVKLDRFQLPRHLRYKGYGPKILNHLLSLYKEAGCSRISVPSPTPSGTKCYEKVGFTRNALQTLELKFRHGAEGAHHDPACSSPPHLPSDAEDAHHDPACSSPPHLPSDGEPRSSDAGSSDDSFSDSCDSRDNIYMPRTKGIASAGYTVPVQSLQRRSNSLTDDSLCSLNDKYWSVEQCEQGGTRTGYVRLIEIKTQNTYEILPSRVPKAKLNLSHDGCMTAMTTNACQCRNNCNQLLQPKDIAKIRCSIYNHCQMLVLRFS